MSMTREEAIALLCYGDWLNVISEHIGKMDTERIAEAMSIVGKALRPVSRKQVEKMWKGEWIIPTIIGGRAYNIPHCSACNGVPCGTDEHTRFCAHCGAPMTDEGVDMEMERLNKLEETKK